MLVRPKKINRKESSFVLVQYLKLLDLFTVEFSVERITAMALVWQYGEKAGNESWKGLSWGMVRYSTLFLKFLPPYFDLLFGLSIVELVVFVNGVKLIKNLEEKWTRGEKIIGDYYLRNIKQKK